jgi:heme exporter protein A
MVFAPVSFVLNGGESLLISGPNGAGKSSLIRMIARLLPVFGGTLNVSTSCALSDERLAMDSNISLIGAMRFWACMDGRDDTVIERVLEQYALLPLRDIPVAMLSTGQRKRAMLARTLASGAQLWLLDEPGNGLDGPSLELLGAAMRDHVAQGGAIIAASHFALPFSFTREIALPPPPHDATAEDTW